MTVRELLPPELLSRWSTAAGRTQRGAGGWYTIRNEADRALVELYDVIGEWGISAREFVRDLRGITAPVIDLRINSPGGLIYDGFVIYNALRDHPARVEATVDGLAASAASWVLQAAEHRVMNRHSELMIHDGLALTIGNEADHLETAAQLGRLSDNIASIYATRAGGSADDWRAAMRAETWYTAAEAAAAGLADEAIDDEPASNILPRTQLVTARARAHLERTPAR
ncbi:head maturation protease, ClpP-related [Micromonospora eburnea]|uniref:ATP-dependent Clp protease proteolytic subunit n=1 Tax=Micromonospora eburnea TaxID=227316 RepID=A0A1C6TQ87_9ACTN|nr:head maturation protease, ClpP-related [Micromonospora eburnea]SCL43818.1 ATP-dependent protease ClpP, protease subunit [Micromonospora eburnea]SCL43992.1 ATP-dependent protease ClpP, protease subunit [Micromonospora eburnea]